MAENERALIDTKSSGKSRWHRFIPYFLIVFVLYLLGAAIPDPRAPFITAGTYQLSWLEVLLILATVLSLAEQMKVSHPGIDNTLEALAMVAMGVVQLIIYVLGATGMAYFHIFNNTQFLELTFISLAAAVVAILINARTLRRTIGVGDD